MGHTREEGAHSPAVAAGPPPLAAPAAEPCTPQLRCRGTQEGRLQSPATSLRNNSQALVGQEDDAAHYLHLTP